MGGIRDQHAGLSRSRTKVVLGGWATGLGEGDVSARVGVGANPSPPDPSWGGSAESGADELIVGPKACHTVCVFCNVCFPIVWCSSHKMKDVCVCELYLNDTMLSCIWYRVQCLCPRIDMYVAHRKNSARVGRWVGGPLEWHARAGVGHWCLGWGGGGTPT